jgi:signal peptidase I
MERTILLLAGLVIFCTWFVEGFPVFCVVQGGSMATTLLGSHVDCTCPSCNFTFSRDAQDCDDSPSAVCPNCAAKFALPAGPRVLAGDRVLIDRTAFQVRRPRRWEVVAFQRFGDEQELVVKRVVGLPGEEIQIIDGDIYADGKIQRKTLRQQRALRVLVHDDDYAGATPRWRPQDAGSNWTRQHGRLVHAENTGDDIGWLVYNHASPGSDNAQAPARVTDYGFYNRGRFQRDDAVHPMADVAMSFRIDELHGRGLLWLQATDGRDEFMVRIDPAAGKFLVLKNREKNRQAPVAASGDLPDSLRGQTIEVSLFDRQFLFAIAGRTLAAIAIDTPGPPPLADQPLAIGAEGLGVIVDRLRVYRDVYYTEPPFALPGRPLAGHAQTGDNAFSCVLGAEEYFVVGDNSPVSEDSRTWTEDRFVSPKSLVGKPFVVIFSARDIPLGGWRIQVPDLTRIRYIR